MKRQRESGLTAASATNAQETNKKARTCGPSGACLPGGGGTAGIARLPAEILSLIANGTDAHGRPLLDPRHRFLLRQVCRAFYGCVSSPSAVDAVRMSASGQKDDAWTSGRAASLALVVESARSEGFTPDMAIASYNVPSDPRRGWITAWMASASVDSIVAEFARVAASLLPACPDWFPLADAWPRSWDCWKPKEMTLTTPRDIARRNLVCTACCVGRLDVVDALMGWFGIADLSTLCPAVHVAAHRGQVATVATLLCYMKQRLDLQVGCHASTMRLLFDTAATAAASDSAGPEMMRRLVGWCLREHDQRDATEALVDPKECGAGFRPPILDNLLAAARVRGVACNDVNLDPYWVSTDRLDIISQVIDASRFDAPSVLLMAVVSGSLGIECALASCWDEPGFVVSDLPALLYRAFTRIKESVGAPTCEAFARGMRRLRDRCDIPCNRMLYLADRLNGHLDLAACVLGLWPPVPNTTKWSSLLKGNLVYAAIHRGHWGVLGKIIRAYGRVDDAPDSARSQTVFAHGTDSSSDSDNDSSSEDGSDSDGDDDAGGDDDDDEYNWTRPTTRDRRQRPWWRKVADGVSFARRTDGTLAVCMEKTNRSLAALGLLCQMAFVAGRITPDVASAHTDPSLFGSLPEDDCEIDADDWSRWCGEMEVLPRRIYPPAEALCGETNKKRDLADQCDRLIALLDGAGLVRHLPGAC